MKVFTHLALILASAASAAAATADAPKLPPAANREIDFVKDIQPVLEQSCVKCHGAEKPKGGLRLDAREEAMQGGDDHAPDIIPSKGADSPLLQIVGGLDPDLHMPPKEKGDPLTDEQVGLLRAWIDQGAKWPDNLKLVARKAAQAPGAPSDDRQHFWSFLPLVRPEVPAVEGAAQPNPIDAFVRVQLAKKGIQPSPEADRRTLIRRVYFDLIGLPPSPEEVTAFAQDTDPQAYEKVVDRLLAKPQYGERWARHWLDVVRFAESDGFETNQPRPTAWRYRDWVIQAFNDDLPYDRFIHDQLAGDRDGADAATGFLVAGAVDRVKSPDPVLTANQRADELHDMVGTTASTFLGLTVGCARCHDHKFDPILQTDYYALKAVFAGVQHGERPIASKAPEALQQESEKLRLKSAELGNALAEFTPLAEPSASEPHRVSVNAIKNTERFSPVLARKVRFTIEETNNGSEPCLDEVEVWSSGAQPRNVAAAAAGAKVVSSGDYVGSPKHQLSHLNDGKVGNDWSWISNTAGRGWVEIEFAKDETIDRMQWGRDAEEKFQDRLATRYLVEVSDDGTHWKTVASSSDRAKLDPNAPRKAEWDQPTLTAEQRQKATDLDTQRRALDQQIAVLNAAPVAYAGRFENPPPTYRLSRGDPMMPKEEVAPGGLSELGGEWRLPMNAPDAERREALAKWIASPKNPLTARVMVNRLWHYHFGRGLVETPSDFGNNGDKDPSDPALINWLASEFIAKGWSMKAIHRLICTSATFRQASDVDNKAGQDADAGDRLLWKYPERRLEAEPLRDTILAVTGKIDLRVGGPGFDLFQPNTNYVKVYMPKVDFDPDTFRRMVYWAKPRMQLDDTFGTFDCPDAGQIAPRRNASTTPIQALSLLNSPFTLQQANYFAERLKREAGSNEADEVRRAFQLALGRAVDPDESAAAVALIKAYGLPAFCRAMFNAHEFVTVF